MSDGAWVLKGVDPETRQRAVDEARRMGVSLADYLTNKVLHAAIAEQVNAAPAEEPVAPAPNDLADFGVRQRFRTLERRLETSVSGLDASMHALDTAVFDITARVGELEGFAGDTAQALQQALQDTAERLVALKQEGDADAVVRSSENAAAHESLAHSIAGLSRQIQDVEACARRADTNTAVLADAHETLKQAVASDFCAFSDEIAGRLAHGLRDVAAAADEAAAQADAAVAHLVVELRGVREELEHSVAEGVDETRRRIHAAFSDAAERMEALSDRVSLAERQSALSAEQLRARMADLEDSAQIALEETAESLRQAGAALAADVQRASQDHRAALESVHSDLSTEIADMRDRQQGALARLKLLDAAVSHGVNDVAALRQDLLDRIASAENTAADRVAQSVHLAGEQTDALAARVTRYEQEAAQTHFQLRAETDRVEASTIAALEKLASDIASNRSDAFRALEELRARAQAEAAELRDQQSGFGARLTIIDLALRTQTSLVERITKLEAALNEAASGAKLVDVEAQVNVLRQAVGKSGDDALQSRVIDIEAQLNVLRQAMAKNDDGEILRQMIELGQRLDRSDADAKAGSEKTEDLVRLMGRLTANYAEASTQADERLHKLEVSLADLRLEHLSAREAPIASADDVAALESRLSAVERLQAASMPGAEPAADLADLHRRLEAMEARQTEALDVVRSEIARFIADNDRRLATLEHAEADYNLAAEFDGLRRRVEERIIGIEQRSVRTLEQVADTVQMLEERFMGRDEGERESA